MVAVIIGSTRDALFAPKAAERIAAVAARRSDMEVEIVDLKAFDLLFFNEKASNAWMPSEEPRAVAWQRKIAAFDAPMS